MALASVARAHYTQQSSLTARASAALLELWAQLDPTGLAASWQSLSLAERMFVTLSTFQVASANAGPAYVAAALREQGAESDPAGRLVSQAVAGIASDGRPLESLLVQPLIGTLTALRDGAEVDDALRLGGSALSTIAETQVADAGRAAEQVSMMVEPAVTGYVRMLVPPACGRCAILAGRFYKVSDGFQRHPRCDCRHIPSVEDTAGDLRTDPDAYFRSLSRADQDRYFGPGQAQAIRDGADMSRAVNATGRGSGVYTADGRTFTTEATTRRGTGRRPRLTPAAIYREAGGDRAEAIRLLQSHGYITDPARDQAAQLAAVRRAVVVSQETQRANAERAVAERAAARRAAEEEQARRDAETAAEVNVADLSDAELDAEMAAAIEREDWDAVDVLTEELDRRDRERQAATVVSAAPPEAAADELGEDAERWAAMDEFLARGMTDQEAYAIAFGISTDRAQRDEAISRLRAEGYQGDGFDALARASYKDYLYMAWLDAEEETNGVLLNKAGKSAKIDPRSLFSGPKSRAAKYASEELLDWWEANGRITFEEWSETLLTGGIRANTRAAGSGRAFSR